MSPSRRLIRQLHPVIRFQVLSAVNWLKFATSVVYNARRADLMLGGQGLYEAKILEYQFGSIANFEFERDRRFALIDYWRRYATSNEMAVDFEQMLQQEECPQASALQVSAAAVAHLAG